MSKNLYITSTEARSGKSAIALGLMEMLIRKLGKVAFFRPIVHINGKYKAEDKDISLIASHYQLPIEYKDMYAYTVEEANDMISAGKQDQLLEGILEKYKKLEEKFNFVLCEGTDFESSSAAFELDINIDIANNLGSPVLAVINANNKGNEQIIDSTKVCLERFEERGCNVIASVINRCKQEYIEDLKEQVKHNVNNNRLYYLIPEDTHLSKPSMREIASWLNAEILYGEDRLSRQVHHYTVAGMQVGNFLNQIRDHGLIIVPSDRADIILSSLLSLQSSYFPNIAGILLTEKMPLEEPIWRLITGLSDLPAPILKVKTDTFETAGKVGQTYAGISPKNHRKINTVLRVFDTHVDSEELGEKIALIKPTRTSPKMFEYGLLQKARLAKKHIVLPEGNEERILRAAEVLSRREVVKITLLGNVQKVRNKIARLNLLLDQVHIVDPIHSPHYEDYVNTYHELRKHKGVTVELAKDTMADNTYFGTMMVKKGHANGMVSGSINTTAHTIRPAFEFVKTKPGISTVSSVFFMCLEDRVLVYGDCAVNPNPTPEQLAEIAISSADTAAQFGIEPRIAMLSYSTGKSGGQTIEIEKVSVATALAKEKRPDLKLEGPLQYDAAVDIGVAKTKMPDSEVAGKANVFIFPDLNTGNNTYKAVQRSAKALAIGPILQGLNKPVNDLSRGCTIPDIINTVAITAIQAKDDEQQS